MKLLGLLTVRNGGPRLKRTLDLMGTYCDAVCALNDRSTDETIDILGTHPLIVNVFNANPSLSPRPWFFSEGLIFDLLYRMADFCQPDWVIMIGDDEWIEPDCIVTKILDNLHLDVAGIKLPRISVWDDQRYPLMGELMRKRIPYDGTIWRYYPGLFAGRKPLHNGYFPVNIGDFGKVIELSSPTLLHGGWNTLVNRIKKVDLYSALDPECQYNYGVRYDKGLLWGYARNQIVDLIRDYRQKYASVLAQNRNRRICDIQGLRLVAHHPSPAQGPQGQQSSF